MTFDLFDDPPPAAAAPAPAPATARPATGAILMQPTGVPNRWTYRGVEIGCNMKLQGMVGHWFTIEPLGHEVRKRDMRTLLCKDIDEHLAAGGTP